MADVREILLKLLGQETVSGAARKAADGLDDMGDAADRAARDAKNLDRQLGETERQITDVVRALARDPGDIGLRKQLAALKRESRTLSGIRRQFGDLGDDAAIGFAARFSGRIGPLVASAPISPALVGSVAAAAPLISGAVSAAIAAGAAAGAVAVGAKLVANRTEVESALADTGRELMESLVVDAGPIAEPLVEATDTIRSEFRKLRPEIQGIFSDAAQYVGPLTRGLTGLGRELVPGLREAVREAGPVVDVLAYKLPSAGRTTSNALKAITEDSENAAMALSTLMTGAELGVTATANSIAILNKALPLTTGALLFLNEKLTENDRKAAEAAEAAEDQARAEARRAQAVGRSADEINALNEALAEAPGEALSAEQAMLDFEQSVADTTEAIKDNGRTADTNSQKYRDNKAALLALASSTHSAAEATRRQTGSQEAANQVLDRGRAAFLAAAHAAGVEAAEAKKLAGKLFGIPTRRQTDITVNKQQAERDLARLNSQANYAARDRVIRFAVAGAISGSLGAVGQRAEGGPIKAGRPYLVGEKGPELITPTRDGYVHTAAATRQMTGVSGGQVVTLRLVQQTPDGRVIREQLIDLASRLNVPPVQLWPTS